MKDGSHGMLIGGTSVLETKQHDCVIKIVHGSQERSFLDV